MQLIPVEGDPFAASAPPAGVKLVPVDHDPFAPDRGAGEAALNNAANQALLGFGPQVGGVIAGVANKLGLGPSDGGMDRPVPGTPEPRTVAELAAASTKPAVDPSSFGAGYNQFVDRSNANLDTEAAQHPVASDVGGVGGALATLPLLPEVSPFKVAAYGAAAPTIGARIANIGARVGNAAAGGAAYSAASGAGNARGDLVDRLKGAGTGGVVGLVAGGVLGAPISVVADALAARAAAAAGRPAMPAVVGAAERQGIRLPTAVASDNPVVQQVGGAAKSIPIFGSRMVEAGKRTVSDFGDAASKIAADYGGGAAANPAIAGGAAKTALEDWIGPQSKAAATAAYDKVDALVDPAIKTPLNATAQAATDIVQRRSAATLGPSSAVNLIKQAASDPQGLTYSAIKDLRTRVGEMLGNPQLLPRDMSGKELEKIYGSLSTDLGSAVANAGGSAGQKAFQYANDLFNRISTRRQELANVLGKHSPEGVFSAIANKAGSTRGADIVTLSKLRKSMPSDVWNGIASGVIHELGRSDAKGEISLDRFFTNWNKISPAGKSTLFGDRPDLASSLDDLATVASRSKSVATYANPSGTGQIGGLLALGAAAINPAVWPKVLTGAIGAHYLTRALSNPATVRSMTAWAKTYDRWVRGPTQVLGSGIKFSAQRLASEIGQQFGLGPQQINSMALALSGGAQPTVAQPTQNGQGKPNPGRQ